MDTGYRSRHILKTSQSTQIISLSFISGASNILWHIHRPFHDKVKALNDMRWYSVCFIQLSIRYVMTNIVAFMNTVHQTWRLLWLYIEQKINRVCNLCEAFIAAIVFIVTIYQHRYAINIDCFSLDIMLTPRYIHVL